jgi:hypothetical protein
MTRWICAAMLLLSALGLAFAPSALAQGPDKPVSNLRLAQDSSGTAQQPDPASLPEKVYYLPAGTSEFYVAYDFPGGEPTDVSIRVLGTTGTILFDERQQVSRPGAQVILFRKGDGPLEDSEYVVNAYVGENQYLADSLQVLVGAAQLMGSATPVAASTAVAGVLPTAGPEPTAPTGDNAPLVLAALGLLALGAVVLWALRSAMRPGPG